MSRGEENTAHKAVLFIRFYGISYFKYLLTQTSSQTDTTRPEPHPLCRLNARATIAQDRSLILHVRTPHKCLVVGHQGIEGPLPFHLLPQTAPVHVLCGEQCVDAAKAIDNGHELCSGASDTTISAKTISYITPPILSCVRSVCRSHRQYGPSRDGCPPLGLSFTHMWPYILCPTHKRVDRLAHGPSDFGLLRNTRLFTGLPFCLASSPIARHFPTRLPPTTNRLLAQGDIERNGGRRFRRLCNRHSSFTCAATTSPPSCREQGSQDSVVASVFSTTRVACLER